MAEKGSAPKDFGFGEDEAMLRDLARKQPDDAAAMAGALQRLLERLPGRVVLRDAQHLFLEAELG